MQNLNAWLMEVESSAECEVDGWVSGETEEMEVGLDYLPLLA